MTTWTRKALLLTVSAAAAAGTLAAVGAPVAHSRPAGTATAPLDWGPCAPLPGVTVPAGQQCATLRVPLDHRAPGGRTVDVAVSRLRTDRPEARRGILLVLAGGPGGSGVLRLAQKGEALRAATEGAYDLVGLDPRGVGGSTRAGCGIPEADRHLVTLRAYPAADGSITRNTERARRTAEACARDGGPVVRSFSTRNQARDIDRLRAALGERKLSVWAHSYGSYAGAVYAQEYPRRVDRLVLDSVGDPDPARVGHGWLANTAPAVALRFPDFAAWAADPARDAEGLRLARRAEDVEPLFLDLARALDRVPKESEVPGVPLTGDRLRQALQGALQSDRAFPSLARLIRSAQEPAGRPALPPEQAGALPDEDATLTMAVVCNDVRWPGPDSGYARRVAADRARYPLTAGMPVNIAPCAFWRYDEEPEATRITDDGPSNVLMIQSLRDPATPYAGALKMREALGERARMVTVERGGHGMYLGNGNDCGDRTVSDFLVTGERPARDAHCPN
ncbi:alpha/beta hydrolase [Streptomyces sp. DH8]|uniref:alpha/beta hydrolase n=1 Tax=Streptomyces sp. DH8 TaxID=2857008 RepID=UPI001E3EA1FA|nr:alpha/beta hydrolase [Streptomyces sp. DH8]